MATIASSTVAFEMWYMMYLLFLLLPAIIPAEAKTDIYEVKMTANKNHGGLAISFRLRGDAIDQLLRGLFKVEHKDCGAEEYCGKTNSFKNTCHGCQIRVQTVLDPCISHTEIKIKASRYEGDGGGAVVWKRNWDAIDCSKLSTETEEKTETETKEMAETNFFTENSFQNSIILTIALLAIIAITVTVSLCIICRKKNEEKRRRNEPMNTDENPIYGTYEHGPVYNIVTDENAYYST